MLLLPWVTEGYIEKQNCCVLIYMYFADIFSLYFSWLQSLVFWIWFYLAHYPLANVAVFLKLSLLTHWGRDKMAAILQTTFSNAFSWMKMHEFHLRFHWSLFLRLELTIFQHWFKKWLGADKVTSHYLNQWWLDYRRIYASIGLNELIEVLCASFKVVARWITLTISDYKSTFIRSLLLIA